MGALDPFTSPAILVSLLCVHGDSVLAAGRGEVRTGLRGAATLRGGLFAMKRLPGKLLPGPAEPGFT